MDNLVQDFKNSLIASSEDCFDDILEFGIDSFINDDFLKDFPIVSSIVSGLKIAKNIYDRNLLEKVLVFIKELNNGSIRKDKLIAYKSTLENNPKKCQEELKRVLILLNSYIDNEKSVMLARLYKSFVNQKITWSEFCEYSETINRLYLQDLNVLSRIYDGEIKGSFDTEQYRIDRLIAIGLIHVGFEGELITVDEWIDSSDEKDINENDNNIMSEYSRKFVKIVLNK